MENQFKPTAIYVLSVISLLCCCFFGLGIVLAAPAFIMANNKMKDTEANPDRYESATVKAIKTAKTVAMVALIINALYLIYSGYSIATNWDDMVLKFNEAMEQAQQA